MGDMLSQDEINALFGGGTANTSPSEESPVNDSKNYEDILSQEDKDVLGEVGNISMGTAASTLSTLLGQRVDITTPNVSAQRWEDVAKSYDRPCVGIRVNYVEGLEGVNALVLKERDVKIISDLMMGGDGLGDPTGEINEIDLSAITECMNQMIGSSSTSLSSLIKTKIDIDTPSSFLLDFNDNNFFESVKFIGDVIVCIRFRMEIGNLIDSEIMQIWPLDFAKRIIDVFMQEMFAPPKPAQIFNPETEPSVQQPSVPAPPASQPAAPPPAAAQPQAPVAPAGVPPQPAAVPPAGYPPYAPQPGMPYGYPPEYAAQPPVYPYPYPPQPAYYQQPSQPAAPPINAHPAQFESFDGGLGDGVSKENIGIIMDVPLDVTVELGRTTKKIKEILEFQPGSIVELNKLAGETMDVLINGKFVARGEVVVIDENFAIRITDIINVENRI